MNGSGAIQIERRMPGPPETVFVHFTDADLHLKWLGTSVELDPRPGGAYVVTFGEFGQIRGQYLELDPPHRLVLLWGWLDGGGTAMSQVRPSSTRVEIDLIPEGAETIVRVRHLGIPADVTATVTWGWTTYFDRLAMACGHGALAPDPFGTKGPAAMG